MNISDQFYIIVPLKVKDIQRVNVLKFDYKYCHSQLPPYFQRFIFKTRADIIPRKKLMNVLYFKIDI